MFCNGAMIFFLLRHWKQKSRVICVTKLLFEDTLLSNSRYILGFHKRILEQYNYSLYLIGENPSKVKESSSPNEFPSPGIHFDNSTKQLFSVGIRLCSIYTCKRKNKAKAKGPVRKVETKLRRSFSKIGRNWSMLLEPLFFSFGIVLPLRWRLLGYLSEESLCIVWVLCIPGR